MSIPTDDFHSRQARVHRITLYADRRKATRALTKLASRMQESKTPTTMPRNAKPDALQLSLDNVTTKTSASRPNSSPIALEGIDLSSIEGSFTFSLSSLPPLPSSPAPLSSPPEYRDPVKNQLDTTLLNNKSSERLPLTSEQVDTLWPGWEDEDVLRPSSSSMSKIYHLRKAPGSTPELSLVGSADSVSKSTLDGTYSR